MLGVSRLKAEGYRTRRYSVAQPGRKNTVLLLMLLLDCYYLFLFRMSFSRFFFVFQHLGYAR